MSGRRRIGIMGGTFDPIHNGHLSAASEVQAYFQLDEVVFVPVGDPVHKVGRKIAPAEDRYLMTVIATSSNPEFSVSRVDIDRVGYTYTTDTLSDIQALYPDADLFFITGADVIGEIGEWDRAERLFEQAMFVGCTRPGYTLSVESLAGVPADGVVLIEVPALAISSTTLRERVADELPLWYLVPDGVVQYIAKRGLYRDLP